MAGFCSSSKFILLLVITLVVNGDNWAAKVNGVREKFGIKLVDPISNTCLRQCYYDSDCSDGWVCNYCRWDALTGLLLCGPFS